MVDVDQLVGMVPLAEPFVQVALDEVEGIDRLEQVEGLPFVELLDVGLGGVEDHPLHEVAVPVELHLHKESATGGVLTAHIHNAVLAQGVIRHHLGRDILDVGDDTSVFQGKKGVEQAGGQVDVLSEDFPEGDIGHGTVIFVRCHIAVLFLSKYITETIDAAFLVKIFYRCKSNTWKIR